MKKIASEPNHKNQVSILPSEYYYKIEVNGTDIEEYYGLEESLEPEQVEEIWLHHVKNGTPIGGSIAEAYRGNVEVTKLWKEHQEPQATQVKQIPNQVVDEVLEGGEGQQ